MLPDCYWNESDGQLQIALNVYTGTGVAAQELHILRYRDGRLTDSEFNLGDYSGILAQRIQFAYDSETHQLTLTDKKTGKELCTVEISGEENREITGIEAGMISEFILGDTISFQVEPGCYYDEEAVAVYEDGMPMLKAEVIVSESGDGTVFDLGEFSVLTLPSGMAPLFKHRFQYPLSSSPGRRLRHSYPGHPLLPRLPQR